MPVARLVGAAAVAVSVWRSLRAMCSNFRGVVCNAERFAFAFVLRCANRLFGCGVRVSRQIVCFVRSQTSSLARLYCLRSMFVGVAIFIGSICALSRNARVGAGFRLGKCEFAHVMEML